MVLTMIGLESTLVVASQYADKLEEKICMHFLEG